jgi:hypothetical protein
MRGIRWLFILVFLTGRAFAQIGQDEIACQQQWGSPLTTNDSAGAVRCLSYGGLESLSAKLFFIDGLACRAIYEKQDLAMADVEGLLRLNNQGCRWDGWAAPIQGGQPASGRQWMRSDEMATASLTSNHLVIISAEWNRQRPEQEPAVVINQIEPRDCATNAAQSGTGLGRVIEKGKTETVTIRRTLPSRLPGRGASRHEALDVLGPPSGTIMGGSKEVLVYPWGNIWLTDGRVTVVE